MTDSLFWKRCSICKKEIPFNTKYYVCSVSTCRHPRTGYRFCSPGCWDAHLGFANHRGEVWANEEMSPRSEGGLQSAASEAPRAPLRKIVDAGPGAARTLPVGTAASKAPPQALETLVVVSKVKALIAKESSFNTSQCCIDALTRKVAEICMQAIEHARASERKTVMGRDVK